MNHFDKAAKWYDWLSNLVFGDRLRSLERALMAHLPDKGTILWIGGGSGENLPLILDIRPNTQILYLETSEKMSQLAKARISDNHRKVTFISSLDELDAYQGEITATLLFFVLDLFEERDLDEMLSKWLKKDGNWVDILLVADFDTPTRQLGRVISSVLIPLMYTFFRLSIRLPSRKLPNWKRALTKCHYSEEFTEERLFGVIRSGIWQPS